jgi:hypothetical protein
VSANARANGDRGGGCPYRRREQSVGLTGDFFKNMKRNPQSAMADSPFVKGAWLPQFRRPPPKGELRETECSGEGFFTAGLMNNTVNSNSNVLSPVILNAVKDLGA